MLVHSKLDTHLHTYTLNIHLISKNVLLGACCLMCLSECFNDCPVCERERGRQRQRERQREKYFPWRMEQMFSQS